MAILGWLMCLSLVIYFSFINLFALWFFVPKFNPIGGAGNNFIMRLLPIISIPMVLFLWQLLFSNAPFTIIIN